MSFDEAWDDYVEWSGLDQARLDHPAGKGIPASDEVCTHEKEQG